MAALDDVPNLLLAMQATAAYEFTACIDAVWDLLTDVERMAGLGPEHVQASWTGSDRGIGATFLGTNRRGETEWTVPCTVVTWNPPTEFGWTVLDPDNPSSTWSYSLTATPSGTHVVQRFVHGPNFSYIRRRALQNPESAEAIIANRTARLSRDMETTMAAAADLLG